MTLWKFGIATPGSCGLCEQAVHLASFKKCVISNLLLLASSANKSKHGMTLQHGMTFHFLGQIENRLSTCLKEKQEYSNMLHVVWHYMGMTSIFWPMKGALSNTCCLLPHHLHFEKKFHYFLRNDFVFGYETNQIGTSENLGREGLYLYSTIQPCLIGEALCGWVDLKYIGSNDVFSCKIQILLDSTFFYLTTIIF